MCLKEMSIEMAFCEIGMNNAVALYQELMIRCRCPVCQGIIKDPVRLYCEHTVCKQCHIDLIENEINPHMFKCPVCKFVLSKRSLANRAYQLADISEIARELDEKFKSQLCQYCCISDAKTYTALCDDCNKLMPVRDELAPDGPYGSDPCPCCNKKWEEVDLVCSPDCAVCGRWYHLTCHYPPISEDVGEAARWVCRLCSETTPTHTYGGRMARKATKKRVLAQRKILEIRMKLGKKNKC